ncbi:nectin-3-like protein [Megalops cyprinoides]|uniref:nectin-3-like protein n=1 Tax=Megalops cyprinoides TaxID=118141 RepID=UPI001865238C|nr:nectin-3-like protein [Megalops cyprinoides]
MAGRMSLHCHGNYPLLLGLKAVVFSMLINVTGVLSSQVLVPERVSAVLGKNITLGCRVEVGANLSLTQSSWERRLPSGTVTLAVFNPQFGISISPDYEKRLSFRSPSAHDATIVLEDVGFADIGVYTCKVATFPLGNTQASIAVSVMVEPKVYVSAGSMALLDGGNETVVATCTAERARPPAKVSWESDLFGRSEERVHDEPNGTTTTQVRYTWHPTRHAQGHTLTCVVRHPALQTDFRIPYLINVQSAPEIVVVGYDGDWFVGRENVQLQCRANANPPAHHFSWVRLDGEMPEGVEVVNNTLIFGRPLQRNDSGVYRCEVGNDIGQRSRDLRVRIQEPPSTTTTLPTTPVPVLTTGASATTPPNKQRAQFTSPTVASLPEGSLGTIVGGAVGGALFLLLLLVLGGACYRKQRRTFRGDYYTKQYLGPADMQKEPQLDVLQPHELQEVYGGSDPGKGSQDLKPKPSNDVIHPDKDREEWGDSGHINGRRSQREGGYYPSHHNHNHHNMHPRGPPMYTPPTVNNRSPYLPEDCYDNGPDSDFVSHMDGSVISRREWYV